MLFVQSCRSNIRTFEHVCIYIYIYMKYYIYIYIHISLYFI